VIITNLSKKKHLLCLGCALALCLAWLAAGCNKAKEESAKATKTAAAGDKAEGQGKEATAPGAPKAPTGPCAEYAEKLCTIVDPMSPTCQSAKTITELMPEAACKTGIAELPQTKVKYEKQREVCTNLVNKLCTDVGPETKTCEMVRTQTNRFPPEQCARLMEQYPKVAADLKRREEANKPLDAEKQKMIIEGNAPSFGAKDAKVTIVEFSDFQCPYCSKAATTVTKIKEKYADKVHFVFRQYPLSFHQNAHIAAQASLAAHAQGKFWEFHDKLFANQRSLERENIEKYAKEVGLNMGNFKKALDKEEFKKAVDDDFALGEKVAVTGTPTMFLNGARVQNPTDFDLVSKEIDTLLAQK